MNARQDKIIEKLATKQSLSLAELASFFQVSERTIRNDIKAINRMLETNQLQIIRIEKHGLLAYDGNILEIRSYIQADDFYTNKLSQDERIKVAIFLLLYSTDYVTTAYISDQLFVSRATIIKELDLLKQQLKQYGLHLKSSPSKGITLTDSEKQIHLSYLQFRLINFELDAIFNQIMSNQTGTDDQLIENIIHEVETEHQIRFSSESYRLLKAYLFFLIQRKSMPHVRDSRKNPVTAAYASSLVRYLNQLFDTKLDNYFSNFLSLRLHDTFHYQLQNTHDREAVYNQMCTRELIENISKETHIDLTRDFSLFESLSNHLNSIYHNPVNENELNAVLRHIQQTQTDLIVLVQKHIKSIEDFFERHLTESEILYIVIHFCAALERKQHSTKSYSVVLVCNGGVGTSQLIKEKLINMYNIRIVKTLSSRDLASIKGQDADLIITTIPLYDVPLPFVQVSTELTSTDYGNIGIKLNQLDASLARRYAPVQDENSPEELMNLLSPLISQPEQYRQIESVIYRFFQQSHDSDQSREGYLHHFLQPDFIQLDISCQNWQDAITKTSLPLLQHSYIEQKYIQAMIQSMKDLGPYFGIAPGVVLPHAGLEDGSYHSGMAFARLASPINFGDPDLDPIHYVIILAATDQQSHLKALFHLFALAHSESCRKELDAAQTPDEIHHILRKYENELSVK